MSRADKTAAQQALEAALEAQERQSDGFESSVLGAAQEQANRMIEKATQESKAAYDAILSKDKSDPVKAHETETEAILRRKIAGANQENLKKLLVYRKQLVNGLFAECEERLSDFTKTPEYTDFVVETMKPYVEKTQGNPCLILLRIGDDAPKEALKKLFNDVTFEADPSIYLGGAKLICQRVLYDETLGQRLRDTRNSFLMRCDLRIDTAETEQSDAE